jgi:trk system potassium uptake protein TrkA
VNVAIAGGGVVGGDLAKRLIAAGHQVAVIEQSPETVARLEARLPEAEIIRADACEVRSLRRHKLERFDALVAATGDDEDNLVVSLLAKQEFAVPRVLARVNNPKNEHLYTEAWGVDVALSVPQLIAGLVEEEFTVGRMVRLFDLRDQARLVEVTLDERSPIVGSAISDLDVPRAFTFVAVLRDGKVVIPHGDTRFYADDEVLALVTPESEAEGRQLLTGEA